MSARTMSAQCPHYARTTSHQGCMKKTYVRPREMLCGHCADIYRQGYMSALCPHYIPLRFSAQKKTRVKQYIDPSIQLITELTIIASMNRRKARFFMKKYDFLYSFYATKAVFYIWCLCLHIINLLIK